MKQIFFVALIATLFFTACGGCDPNNTVTNNNYNSSATVQAVVPAEVKAVVPAEVKAVVREKYPETKRWYESLVVERLLDGAKAHWRKPNLSTKTWVVYGIGDTLLAPANLEWHHK